MDFMFFTSFSRFYKEYILPYEYLNGYYLLWQLRQVKPNLTNFEILYNAYIKMSSFMSYSMSPQSPPPLKCLMM